MRMLSLTEPANARSRAATAKKFAATLKSCKKLHQCTLCLVINHMLRRREDRALISRIFEHKETSHKHGYYSDNFGDGSFHDECAVFPATRARASGPVGRGAAG